MKKFVISIAAAVALGSTAFAGGDIVPVEPVVDDSGFYVGLGYSYMNIDVDTVGELDGNGVTVLAGYQFNQYIAIEGRYTTSVGDMDATFAGGGAINNLDVDVTNIGIYLKPMYTTGSLTLYALLGYGQLTVNPFGIGDYKESGFQWGIGAGYKVNENLSINVDYMKYYDDTDFDGVFPGLNVDADAFTVSVTYRF